MQFHEALASMWQPPSETPVWPSDGEVIQEKKRKKKKCICLEIQSSVFVWNFNQVVSLPSLTATEIRTVAAQYSDNRAFQQQRSKCGCTKACVGTAHVATHCDAKVQVTVSYVETMEQYANNIIRTVSLGWCGPERVVVTEMWKE